MPAIPDEVSRAQIAKAWGMSLAEFRAQSVDDQAVMIATEMFTGTRDSYIDQWKEQQREKGKGVSSRDELDEMKRRMRLND